MSKNISLRELRRLVNKIRNISYRYQVAVRLKTDPDLYNGTGGSSYSSNERLPKYFSGGEIVYYANEDSNWIDETNSQSLPSGFNQSNKVFSHPSQIGVSYTSVPAATVTMTSRNGNTVSVSAGYYLVRYVGIGAFKFRSDGGNDTTARCLITYINNGSQNLVFQNNERKNVGDVESRDKDDVSTIFYHEGGNIKVSFPESVGDGDGNTSENDPLNGGTRYSIDRITSNPNVTVGSTRVDFQQDIIVDSKINSGIYIPYYVSPGQTVNIQYLSGTWRSDYNNIYVNPDISGAIGKYEPFKPCIASVPGLDPSALYNTSVTGDNFVVEDYGFINLRMADHDGYREDNDGVVTYRVKITSIVTKAPSIKTYVSNRGFTVYSPIQVQDVERIISGDYPKEIIKGESPTAGNVVDDDNAGRGNVAVNLEEGGITGEVLWHGDDGVHPKQANMYAVKNEDFLYLNNILYTIARRVELIEDFDYDDLSNQASKGTKIEQTHFDSMVRVANKILEILDGQQSKFNGNDICDHQCQISCQTGCLVACQSCNNGQCHDQKCGAH
jgi:hypothetical protein